MPSGVDLSRSRITPRQERRWKFAYAHEEKRHPVVAVAGQKKEFVKLKLTKSMSLQEYYDLVVNYSDMLKAIGANIEDESTANIVRKEQLKANQNRTREKPSPEDYAEALARTLAAKFLRGLNDKHAGLMCDLRNSYISGNDIYPKNIQDAFNLAQRWQTVPSDARNERSHSDGMFFATDGALAAGSWNPIKCCNCGDGPPQALVFEINGLGQSPGPE